MINHTAKILETFTIKYPEFLNSPNVYAFPHSGTYYFKSFIEQTHLDLLNLRKSEDFYVDELFNESNIYGSSSIKANYPRSFLDLNREPYELDQSMFEDTLPNYINSNSKRVAIGLGTIPKIVSINKEIYKNKIKWNDIQSRIEKIYFPYHAALKQLLIKSKYNFGYSLLIDCHSMPSNSEFYNLNDFELPDIILGDVYGKSCDPSITSLIENILRKQGYNILRNKFYSGGFCTRNYGRPAENMHAIQIEINRSLYIDETSYIKKNNFKKIKTDISDLIRELSNNQLPLNLRYNSAAE